MRSSREEIICEGGVDLESYSASANWIGFFEASHKLDRRMAAEKAIDEMQEFLKESDVVCSAHFFGDVSEYKAEYEISQLDIDNIVIPLLQEDRIRCYEHYLECEKVRELSWVDYSTKAKLCLAIMDIGIRGHLFFLNRHVSLIAYPHDDIGFGFIGVRKESMELGRGLLKVFLREDYWDGRCECPN